MDIRSNTKGEAKMIGMGVGLLLLIVLGYIMFPVFQGVSSAIDPSGGNASRLGELWGDNMQGAYGNYTNSVGGAVTLFGVSPVVFAAAIVLVILTVYLARQ